MKQALELMIQHDFSQLPVVDENNTFKTFDELSLSEYIQLLLHKSKWPPFNSVFQLKIEALRSLLNGVRETRNALAHFHGEISLVEREQLHFCAR